MFGNTELIDQKIMLPCALDLNTITIDRWHSAATLDWTGLPSQALTGKPSQMAETHRPLVYILPGVDLILCSGIVAYYAPNA